MHSSQPEKHATSDRLTDSVSTPKVNLYQLHSSSESLFIGYWSSRPSHCGLVVGGGYGNYTFQWHGTGETDPRRFLTKVSTDYLYNKLSHPGGIYDPDKTLSTVKRTILQLRRGEIQIDKPFTKQHARAAWFCVEDHDRLNTQADFTAWTHDPENTLPEPWNFASYSRDPLCERFCSNIFPQFQALLTKEIESDGTRQAQPAVP